MLMVRFFILLLILSFVRGDMTELNIGIDGNSQLSSEHEYYVNLLQRFGNAFNEHDSTALVEMMTDDCEFLQSMGSEPAGNKIVGREAVKLAFESTFSNFPDAKWISRSPDFVTYTQNGEWRGVSSWTFVATRKSDGAVFNTNGVDVFTLKDHRIWLKDAYRKDVPPKMP